MISKLSSLLKLIAVNPKYVLMRIIGRYNFFRPLMVRLHHKDFPNHNINSPESIFPPLNIAAIVSEIQRNGYYSGLMIPPKVVKEFSDFATSNICYGNRDPKMGFYHYEKENILEENPGILLGSFYNLSTSCPTIKLIEEDPQILQIAALYLKSKPILQGTNMWWSFAADSSEQDRSKAAQMYHMDLDDYQFIKFFFYLTDVDENSGPHVIVKETHINKKLSHQLKLRRFTDQEIIDEYGLDKIITLCGSAGFGFIEDTLCFHKGYPPYTKDRLVIQVEFGLRDYGFQHTTVDANSLKEISLARNKQLSNAQ
jgi:hypothetical protein